MLPRHPLPVRRPLRYLGHDYATPDAFFVTICTAGRRCTLGRVRGASFEPSETGRIVREAWNRLHQVSVWVRLDDFGLMPNHVHGILEILEYPRTSVALSAPRPDLSALMRVFKSVSTREVNRRLGTVGIALWQRGFHDRIIRNGRELDAIRAYIADNPRAWSEDRLNPLRREGGE